MPESIWKATLEGFRGRVASTAPTPAGVSTAAVSASLGLGLLIKVLGIAKKRKDFSGDPARVEEMLRSAQIELTRLEHFADDDIAAFDEYMACRRLPGDADALAAALRRAIEVPLEAAAAASRGLELCAAATGLTPASIAPDLGSAAALLAGAVRAMLLSVDANVRELADPQYHGQAMAKRRDLGRTAQRLADSILNQVGKPR
jgi:formiminotetrahydrofolate cyclodeaminase